MSTFNSHPLLTDADKAWPSDTYNYRNATTDTNQAINLEAYQVNVNIWLTDGTNTATALINLPPVADGKGKTYTIHVHDASGGVTLRTNPGATYDDSPDWTDIALADDDDRAVLRPDGTVWAVLEDSAT